MRELIKELKEHVEDFCEIDRWITELWIMLPSFKGTERAHGPFKDITEIEKLRPDAFAVMREIREFIFSTCLDYVECPPEECVCGCDIEYED